MRNLIEVKDQTVICDNCNFSAKITGDIKKELDKYHNEICPECGENLLTDEDYRLAIGAIKFINFVNFWFSWITVFFSKPKNMKYAKLHCHKTITISKEEYGKEL